MMWLFLIIILIIFIGIILIKSFFIIPEYKRGVVFALGRYWRVKGPGLVLIIPGLQQVIPIDLRVVTMDIPSQDVISKDNISVHVNAVVYFRVVDPRRAIIQVEDYVDATSQLAQTTLRSVLGEHELDDMLSKREKLNSDIRGILDTRTAAWGVKVSNVEIKQIDLDKNMIKAIAKQAEAERERRAKVITAEGELQAAVKLQEAAKILSAEPASLQLRYLQTASNMSATGSNTVFFPMPVELSDLVKKITNT